MSNLIDDGSLVGFWPLHEPSGAPSWKNYSPARAGHPSGLSFDMHVHVADSQGTPATDTMSSPWPGQEIVFNLESGVTYRGLKLRGENDRIVSGASDPFSNVLVLGNGSRHHRNDTLSKTIAGSGFTAGVWVYPQSDGWTDVVGSAGWLPSATDPWEKLNARVHPVMGQFGADIGWWIGVSGELAGAAQFNNSEFGGPHTLAGYAHVDVAFGEVARMSSPIEAGRYTHLTFSFEYVDSDFNVIKFYKDGNLVTQATTTQDLVLGSIVGNYPLVLGAGTDGASSTDSYEFASGWGHLVSGVYHFRRVLSDSEVLDLHQCGGLQYDIGLHDHNTAIEITDSNLVAYYEGKNYITVDASANHYNLTSQLDPGDQNMWTNAPGPFNTSRNFNASIASDQLAMPSGACYDIAEAAGGFTIAGRFQLRGVTNGRDECMMFSWGSVGTSINSSGTTTSLTGASMGFALSYFPFNGGDHVTAEVWPRGFGEDSVLMRAEGRDMTRGVDVHYGFIYDRASMGVALYVDGYEAASGTLEFDLQDQLYKLAGSGYPLMFMNGVTDDLQNSATSKGVFGDGGVGSTIGATAVLSRPVRADEMRAMAQSGITTSSLWRTPHDPRLLGYWPCDTFDLGDVFASEDRARSMSPVLGHLVRGHSETKWDRVFPHNNDQTIFRNDGTAYTDLFTGETRAPDELQQTFGNLGITSGVFCTQGFSTFASFNNTNNATVRNTPFNLSARYRPATESPVLQPQSMHEWLVSFEVTPSGNIQPLEMSDQTDNLQQRFFNSRIFNIGDMGDGTSDGELYAMLTSIHATDPDPAGADALTGPSGVTIVFASRNTDSAAGHEPLISGTLSYGIPNKVLFHMKFPEPYAFNQYTIGSAPIDITLWIDGEKVNARRGPATDLDLWSDITLPGTTANWLPQFGGYAGTDSIIEAVDDDAGLGEIYMREIFIMRGIFEKSEVEALAVSGIQNPSIPGFVSQLPTTQVSIADSNLEGYWRFNGFDGNVGQMTQSPGGSGTTDLSFKANHLDAIAQRYWENEQTGVETAELVRAIPGPHLNSDLGVQCSGFHFQSDSALTANSTDQLPIFAVSGAAFDTPYEGFSVGFLMAKRNFALPNNGADVFMCYGALTSTTAGTITATDRSPDRGWAIYSDDNESYKMTISLGGNMYLDTGNNTSKSGQITAQVVPFTYSPSDLRSFNTYSQGQSVSPSVAFWDHYCWVYDPQPNQGSGLRMYLNGVLVDQQKVNAYASDGEQLQNPFNGLPIRPQVPLNPAHRMITFKTHQQSETTPWTFFQTNMADLESVFTDVCYFSRVLTEPEVRYIAMNGIDNAVGTETSGIIGGYVHGQDTGSGIVAGYLQGQDTGSGIVGGFVDGSIQVSGIIGGFVSGVVFGTGHIGAYVQGLDFGSGHIGGYLTGSEIVSGVFGGLMRGGDVGSGMIGGYVVGSTPGSGILGGYIQGSIQASGMIGGWMLGGLQGNLQFDTSYTVQAIAAQDFDAILEARQENTSDFDAKLIVFQSEQPPEVGIIIPGDTVTGLVPPFNQYFIGKASGLQGKSITQTRWTFGDLSPTVSVAESGAGCYATQHRYASSGIFIAKFEAIDSNGIHNSATRIINVASGIPEVIVTISGVPRSGNASLIVDFDTNVDSLPPGVGVSTQLLLFDDGQTTTAFNPTHAYTQPGIYKPVWCVRDTRGFLWCDTLESGHDQ